MTSRERAKVLPRRQLLRLGAGLAVAAAAWPVLQACGGGDGSDSAADPTDGPPSAPDGTQTIDMGGPNGELAFIPDRIIIQPGETVRWVVQSAGHSATVYHPDNHDLYESRIPEGAEPWNSNVLLNKGETFEHAFTEPGVYQYYCIPHEGSGMVGTIIVGSAVDGPGTGPVQEEVPAAARSKLEELVAWAQQQA